MNNNNQRIEAEKAGQPGLPPRQYTPTPSKNESGSVSSPGKHEIGDANSAPDEFAPIECAQRARQYYDELGRAVLHWMRPLLDCGARPLQLGN